MLAVVLEICPIDCRLFHCTQKRKNPSCYYDLLKIGILLGFSVLGANFHRYLFRRSRAKASTMAQRFNQLFLVIPTAWTSRLPVRNQTPLVESSRSANLGANRKAEHRQLSSPDLRVPCPDPDRDLKLFQNCTSVLFTGPHKRTALRATNVMSGVARHNPLGKWPRRKSWAYDL